MFLSTGINTIFTIYWLQNYYVIFSINSQKSTNKLKLCDDTIFSDEITLLWELEESARNDLSPMSGRLTFPSGIRSRSIILRSIPDQELEGVEIYNLNLITATGGAEISPVAREAKV